MNQCRFTTDTPTVTHPWCRYYWAEKTPFKKKTWPKERAGKSQTAAHHRPILSNSKPKMCISHTPPGPYRRRVVCHMHSHHRVATQALQQQPTNEIIGEMSHTSPTPSHAHPPFASLFHRTFPVPFQLMKHVSGCVRSEVLQQQQQQQQHLQPSPSISFPDNGSVSAHCLLVELRLRYRARVLGR